MIFFCFAFFSVVIFYIFFVISFFSLYLHLFPLLRHRRLPPVNQSVTRRPPFSSSSSLSNSSFIFLRPVSSISLYFHHFPLSFGFLFSCVPPSLPSYLSASLLPSLPSYLPASLLSSVPPSVIPFLSRSPPSLRQDPHNACYGICPQITPSFFSFSSLLLPPPPPPPAPSLYQLSVQSPPPITCRHVCDVTDDVIVCINGDSFL